MINFAIPSIFIKQLRHLFDRLRQVQRTGSKAPEQIQMAELLRAVSMAISCGE